MLRSIAFLKKEPVSKSSISGKVAVLKKDLFWESNFVEKAAILKTQVQNPINFCYRQYNFSNFSSEQMEHISF